MECVLKQIRVMLVALITVMPIYISASSGTTITPNQVISVHRILDTSYVDQIMATVGTVGSDPCTWVTTNLSASFIGAENFEPLIVSNCIGDTVVAWVYMDATNIAQIAASILLHGTTTWSTSTVSANITRQGTPEFSVFLDENGQALIEWMQNDPSTTFTETLGASSLIKTGLWSAPFVVMTTDPGYICVPGAAGALELIGVGGCNVSP
ncbi:MAG: hypothetical protein WC747_03770, partial [Candidatus Babeliales bacterium]